MADLGDKTCFTTSRRRCGFVFTSTLAAASCASSESLTPDSVTNRGLMEKSPKPHGNFMANLDTWNHLCMKWQILYTAVVSNKRSVKKLITKIKIKGPENPTRQLLPIMSTKCCSGDGEGRKDKGGGGGPRSKTKLCVCVCYKVVCGRWCVWKLCERERVTKLCVKDGVWQSGVWKMVCQRWWVTKWCVKDGVPRLPRETKVDVTKCHACHAKCRGVTGD